VPEEAPSRNESFGNRQAKPSLARSREASDKCDAFWKEICDEKLRITLLQLFVGFEAGTPIEVF
jgi:hypothetical protein